jgi:hypothetical protein
MAFLVGLGALVAAQHWTSVPLTTRYGFTAIWTDKGQFLAPLLVTALGGGIFTVVAIGTVIALYKQRKVSPDQSDSVLLTRLLRVSLLIMAFSYAYGLFGVLGGNIYGGLKDPHSDGLLTRDTLFILNADVILTARVVSVPLLIGGAGVLAWGGATNARAWWNRRKEAA